MADRATNARRSINDPMAVTPRSALRAECGWNSHFCWDPSNYSKDGVVNEKLVQAAIDLGAGLCRERWFPNDKQQQQVFVRLGEAGIRLFTTMADMGSKPGDIEVLVDKLVDSPILPYVQAVTGPNEMNGNQGAKWVANANTIQRALYTTVRSYPELSNVEVVSGSLKHNVKDYDADLSALAETGYYAWCDAADMHYYPGRSGPVTNKGERERVRQCFWHLDTYHSETGWTEADTEQAFSGPGTVETYLRGYLDPTVKATFIYELIDEKPITEGREGMFGMLGKNVSPKLAYSMAQELLRPRHEPEQPFPGWLSHPEDQAVVLDYVVTSEGDGCWTVYLLRSEAENASSTVTIMLPGSTSYGIDIGTVKVGSAGNRRYTITLDSPLTIAHVAPQE
jgi:hypothetical protein